MFESLTSTRAVEERPGPGDVEDDCGRDQECNRSSLRVASSFSLCTTTFTGTRSKNKDTCVRNSSHASAHAKNFPIGRWTFLRLGSEEKWHGTLSCKPEGTWNDTAKFIMREFAKSGHPVFRCSSLFPEEF